MTEIFEFCKWCSVVFCVPYLFCIVDILSFFSNKTYVLSNRFLEKYFSTNNSRAIKALLVSCCYLFFAFILLFSNSYFVTKYFNFQNLEHAPDGVYCYYIEATNSKGKTYMLPAEIEKYDNRYNVYYAYFDNGGYLDFRGSCSDIAFNSTADAFDRSDRDWEVRLTNRKAYHENIEETEPTATISDCFVFVLAILQITALLFHWFGFLLSLKCKEEA